jgi:hypothetical protein
MFSIMAPSPMPNQMSEAVREAIQKTSPNEHFKRASPLDVGQTMAELYFWVQGIGYKYQLSYMRNKSVEGKE